MDSPANWSTCFWTCDREYGEAPGRNKLHHTYVLFLSVSSGILYLNDDFQGGGLFFTEMDTVTVTVSLGLAKRGRADWGQDLVWAGGKWLVIGSHHSKNNPVLEQGQIQMGAAKGK